MRTVALATHGGCPKLSADDQLLIPHLRDFDIEAKAMVWDNYETDWSEFDQVIIRSCWATRVLDLEESAAVTVRRFRMAQALTHQSIVCYNQHAGHGQMLRVAGLASGTGWKDFLTVSCR
jgi:hypothetical protein